MHLPEPRKDAPAADWHAIAYVGLDPSQPWTVANLAHEFGLSVRRLQELLAAHVGVAPLPYLRSVRREQARARLLVPNQSDSLARPPE